MTMTTKILGAIAAAALCGTAAAQPFEITWHTIDGGGGRSTGGTFAVTGTIGQWDAGTVTGGVFEIRGGFWDLPGEPTCPADFNGDGFVDFFDFQDFVDCFEGVFCPPGKDADFNLDGFVDFFDFQDFVDAFEIGC
ncbi:MAG: hypothetical protein HRU70_13900 [Phycisphaeraceae bacterium]|nr:MAG: hypothetical protein HRU70_13900 [Phycisphaeraceae bacterium]